MADSNQPWGDALAPIERTNKEGVVTTVWIDLGPVWMGESGALTLQLMSEPLHWRAHNAERRIVIKPREQEQPRNNGGTGRGGQRR